MAKCRHLTSWIATSYVLSNLILVFWQKNVLVIYSTQNDRRQNLSWIQVVLLLLSQDHLMFGFLYFGRMTGLFIRYRRIQQLWLALVHHFDRRRSSDLRRDFDDLRQFSLLFNNILIYYSFLWFINDRILLRLLWVVITFVYSIISLSEIRWSSILDDDVVAKHIGPTTLNVSVRSWSAEDAHLVTCFIAICYCCVNFLVFGWNLNWMSGTLFADGSCRSGFLLLKKWNVNSFIWLHDG